jgi:hypothetical protein
LRLDYRRVALNTKWGKELHWFYQRSDFRAFHMTIGRSRGPLLTEA